MPLLNDVTAAIADAMRQHDAVRLSTLRMLKAALMNREVERGRALDDAESLQVLQTLIKQRKESAEQFAKGGRADLADKETREVAIIETYLPAGASETDMDRAIETAIAETGATSGKQMGAVIKAARARLEGKTVDGKALSDRVRERLARLS